MALVQGQAVWNHNDWLAASEVYAQRTQNESLLLIAGWQVLCCFLSIALNTVLCSLDVR